MIAEQWEQAKQILEAALGYGVEQRAAFLDSECGSDHELRKEVESLLASHQEAGSQFLAAPAPELLRLTDFSSVPTASSNKAIGPYRLEKEIGRGGMGQVWLAEQTAPVKRWVALKLVRTGTYDDELLKRFQLERQSLALMDHPGIAKVFDAGSTADGQPYFVMEYVPGLPITAYCDQKRLNIRERVELFIRVCEAVQHAHQKAIIHRDLKPANILVQEIDGTPVPRVIDFGLAKAIHPDLAGQSLYTHLGSFVGTPGYMSPEQCDRSAHDVDTRTDVYSLGAVLYVLLTGLLPFQSDEDRPVEEILRQVREEDPPRPSTIVSTHRDSSTAAAEARSTDARQLVSLLRGDLDWITMKAIEKDRSRRYATPNELAADLRHYLRHEPVVARPASVSYRATKFLVRHRLPVAVTVVVIASLALGLYQANRERRIAERRFQQLRQLSTKVFDLDKSIQGLPGSTKARQKLVAASLEYLERLDADARGDVDLSQELGEGYWRVARVQGVPIELNLGEPAQAEVSLKKADQRMNVVLAARPTDRKALLRSGVILHDWMILAWQDNHNDQATTLAVKAAERFEAVLARSDAEESERNEVAGSYVNLALVSSNMHAYPQAIAYARRSVEVARPLPSAQRNLAAGLRVLANALFYQGDTERALEPIQEARSIAEKIAYPDEELRMNTMCGVDVAAGNILGRDGGINLGRPEEAIRAYRECMDLADNVARKDPDDQTSRARIGTAGIQLGDILRRRDPQQAVAVYDAVARRLREVRNDPRSRDDEAIALAGSASALLQLRRTAEAKQRIDSALAILKEMKEDTAPHIDPDDPAYAVSCAMADYKAEEGDPQGAVRIYEPLLGRVIADNSDRYGDVESVNKLSRLYESLIVLHRRLGDNRKAEEMKARERDLWRHWAEKIPNNAFVLQQLNRASNM